MNDAAEHLASTLRALSKGVQENEAKLSRFRKEADEYCEKLERLIEKDKQRIEVFRTHLVEMGSEDGTARPLARALRETSRSNLISQSEIIRQTSRDILAASKTPLDQVANYNRMKDKGVVVEGKNPLDLIRAALRRGPDFDFTAKQGWRLKADL